MQIKLRSLSVSAPRAATNHMNLYIIVYFSYSFIKISSYRWSMIKVNLKEFWIFMHRKCFSSSYSYGQLLLTQASVRNNWQFPLMPMGSSLPGQRTLDPPLSPRLKPGEIFQRTCLGGWVIFFWNVSQAEREKRTPLIVET